MTPEEFVLIQHVALLEERARRRAALPQKTLAVSAVLFSLLSVGLSAGFHSLLFVVGAAVVALFGAIVAINAWGFRGNLKDTEAELRSIQLLEHVVD